MNVDKRIKILEAKVEQLQKKINFLEENYIEDKAREIERRLQNLETFRIFNK